MIKTYPWRRPALTLQRTLAAFLILLIANDLRLWSIDADPESIANLFCARTDLPAVAGPSDWIVTAHSLDCRLLTRRSTTYVYLHLTRSSDDPTDLIFRYDGGTPQVAWTDPNHLRIHVGGISRIDKLLAIYGGVRITVMPVPGPPIPDAPR